MSIKGKSISIKATDNLYNQLQLIILKESIEKNIKVYMKDIILESIEKYALPKYGHHLANDEVKAVKAVKRGRKKAV